jgi:hypothetical protein
MASYPGAVKTFTSKSNGDTIQATHITDLQDEVTALEDGLLNGTAPINSSRLTAPAAQITNCTLASLTVTGGSTFASLNVPGASTFGSHLSVGGNLLVSGGSTLMGSVVAASNLSVSGNLNVVGTSTFTGALFVATPPPCARVYNDAAIAIGTGTPTGLNFNAQRYTVPTSMHSTTTNSSRLTAPSSGVYLVTGHVQWAAGAGSTTGIKAVWIVENDNTIIAKQSQFFDKSAAATVEQSVSAVWTLQANAYVTLRVQQDTGSTGSLTATASYSPEFTLTKIR